MRMLADVMEVQDPLLRRQAGEAARLARTLCRRLGLEEREEDVIAAATLLRDIGHVAIPERILFKPGPLSVNERSVVELHPRVGFKLIGELPALRDVASAVLYHHERFDGNGYPMGLAGTAIPRAARVVAVVDAYSAIVHDRPHSPARSVGEALGELTAGAGTQFDPEITQLFLEEMRTGSGVDQELIGELPSALDIAGLPVDRVLHISATDPLTVLPGHRAFREAAHAAAQAAETDGGGLLIAIVQLERLEDVNRRDGYVAGDQAILSAARASQLAAVRHGGSVYRDSGRRLAILVTSTPSSAQPDLAAELQLEFALGPAVRVGVATRRAGESGEDVIGRARIALSTEVVSDNRP
jgi:GGDEF domain-containing protein